jgi:quercetin dioxygenase-like cupin family protein
MSDDARGAIVRLADLSGRTDIPGHVGLTAYPFASPGHHARWLQVTLDVIEEGGGIEDHYHEGFESDHAYYVIDGTVEARVGDQRYTVGAHSLMVFPSEVVHGFRVVSPGGARVLRLGASAAGVTTGGSIWVR